MLQVTDELLQKDGNHMNETLQWPQKCFNEIKLQIKNFVKGDKLVSYEKIRIFNDIRSFSLFFSFFISFFITDSWNPLIGLLWNDFQTVCLIRIY